MDSLTTILIFAVLLVVSILTITIIQKKEKEKAEIRQKISQYKYRAKQAMDILANFALIPIGLEARKVLMQYALTNLKAAEQLNPQDGINNRNIELVKTEIQTPHFPVDSESLVIPTDLEELQKKVSQFSTLSKYITQISTSPAVNQELGKIASHNIITRIFELKICAHFQQGKELLEQRNYVKAQNQFISARDLLQQLPQKNEKLTQIETELLEVMGNKNSEKSTEINESKNIRTSDNHQSQDERNESVISDPNSAESSSDESNNDESNNEISNRDYSKNNNTDKNSLNDNVPNNDEVNKSQALDSNDVFGPKKKW